MKLWNSCLLVEAESRKVIMAFDDTPSASGTLLGRMLPSFFSLHEIRIEQKMTSTVTDLKQVLFIASVLKSYVLEIRFIKI